MVLLLSAVSAASITSHSITLTLNTEGGAYVQEEYLLRLNNEDLSLVEAGTVDWPSFGVAKTVTKPSSDANIIPEVTQSDLVIVTLQYSVPEIIDSVERKGKQEVVGVTEKAFSFYDGSVISLPYDPPTELVIRVPSELSIASPVTPPAYSTSVEIDSDGEKYSVFSWNYRHPFSTEKFRVGYETEVSIQSQLSFRAFVEDVRERFGNPVYWLVAVIIVVIAVMYRKEIALLASEAFAGEPVLEEDVEDESVT